MDFSKVEIKTIDLGHNTYRLEGQGGNITVAVGSDGRQFAPAFSLVGLRPLSDPSFPANREKNREFG